MGLAVAQTKSLEGVLNLWNWCVVLFSLYAIINAETLNGNVEPKIGNDPSDTTTADTTPTPNIATADIRTPNTATTDITIPNTATADITTLNTATTDITTLNTATTDITTANTATADITTPNTATTDITTPNTATTDITTPNTATTNIKATNKATTDITTAQNIVTQITTLSPTTQTARPSNRLTFKPSQLDGKSQLHSYCDYTLYSVLYLPFQKHLIGRNHSKMALLSINFFSVLEEAIKRLSIIPELTVGDLLCNTQGFDLGYRTPMQCNNITKRCECLVINDLRTVQPLGVDGCQADLGSFCIPGEIECAFGYDCLAGRCEDSEAAALLPGAKNVLAAIITLCTMNNVLT